MQMGVKLIINHQDTKKELVENSWLCYIHMIDFC
jgi:hypothetical protein